MDNKGTKNTIEVENLEETALECVSHLLTADDWDALLRNRMKDVKNVKPLSADFIIRHKNEINMANLPAFVMFMKSDPNIKCDDYTVDFFHRFWRDAQFDGGKGALLEFAPMAQIDHSPFLNEFLANQCRDCLGQVLLEGSMSAQQKKLPTWQEYEKNPYFYDSCHLQAMALMKSEVPMEIGERFVHIFPFGMFFTNNWIKPEVKEKWLEHFGVQLGKSDRYLLPCGTVVHGENHNKTNVGAMYYNNVKRFKTEDEAAIRAIIKKFPRAIEDCFFPENAEAMKSK